MRTCATALLLAAALLAGCTRGTYSGPASSSLAARLAQLEASAKAVPFDQWFVDAASGKKTGWSRRALRQDAAGNWVFTESSTSIEMHGGDRVEASGVKETVETADHRPVSIITRRTEKSGQNEQTVSQEWRFSAAGIELTSRSGGTEAKRMLPPVKGRWFAPAKAAAIHRAHHLAGDKAFEIPVYDPGLGAAPYNAIYARLAEETLALPAGTVKATKYKMTYSNLPGVVSYEWYDADGKFVDNSYTMGGIELTNQWATPELAQAAFSPSEMTGMSVVAVDKPIPTPALLRKAVYELDYSADCPLTPLALCEQTVEKLGPGRVKVTVDLDAPEAQLSAGAPPTDEDLAPSLMIDFKDPSVQALLPKIFDRFAGAKLSQDLAARETTRFVSRYMADGANLSVSSGTASQTAKSKTGDCTEHAVLLAALLRAQGIPARTATGMAYAGEEGFVDHKNAFIFHMWTQAWLKDEAGKGRWVNLDAALRRYDAVHILLGTSSMDDATGADEESKVMPLMESLKVKVLETSR